MTFEILLNSIVLCLFTNVTFYLNIQWGQEYKRLFFVKISLPTRQHLLAVSVHLIKIID